MSHSFHCYEKWVQCAGERTQLDVIALVLTKDNIVISGRRSGFWVRQAAPLIIWKSHLSHWQCCHFKNLFLAPLTWDHPSWWEGTCTGIANWLRERIYSIRTAITNLWGISYGENKNGLRNIKDLQRQLHVTLIYRSLVSMLNWPSAVSLVLHKSLQNPPHPTPSMSMFRSEY